MWERINGLRGLYFNALREAKWEEDTFCPHKAKVLAVASDLAYVAIDLKIENTRRAHLIPSLLHNFILSTGQYYLPSDIARGFEMELIDVFYGQFTVTTIAKVKDLFIVSFRGTQEAHDWAVNFNAVARLDKTLGYHFHSGFLKAALLDEPGVTASLGRLATNKEKVYFCGHSLGGSVSSIIFMLIAIKNKFNMKSSYIYGAPRFIRSYAPPEHQFHIVRVGDVVPFSVPRALQLINPVQTYYTSPLRLAQNEQLDDDPGVFNSVFKGRADLDHVMEAYLADLFLRG
ncbi:MAG: hypothetical protein KIS81_08845 [Maricaulaceae bacterium]|nr:hypothetical protein [Maricaulaceae bacterium]